MGHLATTTLRSPAPVLSLPAIEAPSPTRAAYAGWDPLLLCVGVYILTAVGRVHQLFPALESLRPATLAGLLAILFYLGNSREERRGQYVLVPTTRWLFAFLFWVVLSVPGALVAGRSFELLFENFIKTVVMYFVIAGSIRHALDVERLAMTYLLGAAMYAGVVITRFDVGQGGDWRLGRLYYYDANDFATFAVSAMPFAIYFLHAGRRLSTRALSAIALAVLTLAFVRTGSRGGFVALLAVAAYVVLRYSAVALRWRMTAAALVAVVVFATASDQYWKQMSTIVSDADYNRTDESGRMQIWRRGIGYMLRNPVFGVGAANFQAAEGNLSPFAERQQFGIGVRWNAAHNTFVQVGAELGVPGLAIFIGMLVCAFAALRSARRAGLHRPQSNGPLTQALTASLIGFLVGSCFLSLAYSEMLYTLLATIVGWQKVASMSASDDDFAEIDA